MLRRFSLRTTGLALLCLSALKLAMVLAVPAAAQSVALLTQIVAGGSHT